MTTDVSERFCIPGDKKCPAKFLHGAATRWKRIHAPLILLAILHLFRAKSSQGNPLPGCTLKHTPTHCFIWTEARQGRRAALLRQVWPLPSRWHIEDGLRRAFKRLPAVAGGCLLTLCLATSAVAEGWTSGSSFDPKPSERNVTAPGSSFSGVRVASSFDQPGAGFALAPKGAAAFRLPGGTDALVKLQALIQHAESRRAGYDAWHESATVPPPKAPSRMTLAEIRSWIAATPGQHHAIGRYQIVPDTLESLIRRTGLPAETRFDAKIQDALATILILDAGYAEFAAGRITPGRFMDNLARIWAGFPLESGLSAHDGVAGNKATVTRAFFVQQMAEIFPQQWEQAQLPRRQAGGS